MPDSVLLRIGPFDVLLRLEASGPQSEPELGDILEIRLHGLSQETFMIGDAPSLPSSRTTSDLASGTGNSPLSAPSATNKVEAITSNIQTQANTRVLQVGQTLSARILEVGNNEVRLEVGNQSLRASLPPNLSASDLRPGQPVQIQVLSLGNPPLLRLVLPTEEDSAQAQLMRLSLPRQSGVNTLLEQLNQLLSGKPESNASPERLLLQVVQQLGQLQADTRVRQVLAQVALHLAGQQSNSQMQQALTEVARQLANPNASPSSLNQLQQALNQMAQQLAAQSPAAQQAGPNQLQQALAQLIQQNSNPGQTNNQLQQLFNQLAQQLGSQSPSVNQIQQALSQVAQQLGSQGPTSPQQLQEAAKDIAQKIAQQPGQVQINNQTAQANQVNQLSPQATAQAATTPAAQEAKEVEELLRLLNDHSLNEKQLGPAQLRGLFLGSGLFLEASLAQSRAPRANDLKSLLLRVATILKSNSHQDGLQHLLQRFTGRNQSGPPQNTQEMLQTQVLTQLRKATEGALAKIELQQLQSLPPKGDEQRQSWHFALTLNEEARFQEVEAHIEREKSRKRQEEDRWNVELHFDFEASGPLDARIQLQQRVIQVNFWASRAQTLERVKELLPRLEAALKKAGLEVGTLAAWPGAQPKAKATAPLPATNLLNLRA